MLRKLFQRRRFEKGKEKALTVVAHHVVAESTPPSSHVGTTPILAVPPDPTHRPPSASLTPAAPVTFLEGATNTTFHNSTINNIGGNATIFKLNGGEFSHCQ